MNNRQLYDNHLSDLKRVCPQAGNVFVCPICFQVFSESDALNRENVNLGHVWPEYLRNKSETAKHQQVLVCKKCNSLAGSHGDKVMQAYEENRQKELSGEEYLVRGYFQREKEDIFRGLKDWLTMRLVYGPVKGVPIIPYKSGYFEHNKDFLYLANQGCDVLYILDYYDWNLAQVGWLTSAYLFAFYTFGYKFIFRQSLDIVRQIILESFNDNISDKLDYDENNPNLCVWINNLNNDSSSQIPIIGCEVPNQKNQVSFFEIIFLNYHIRLPIITQNQVISQEKATIGYELRIPKTQHRPHEGICEFDTILEIMDYQVVGSKLIPYQHY